MTSAVLAESSYVPDFTRAVEEESGQQINLCYQCRRCASGCPVIQDADYTPAQIIHAIRLGLKDLVLNSKTIWLCASCETCTARCPQEVEIARVMDAARIIARREKVASPVWDVPVFYTSTLENIRLFGRLYELGLIGALKLRTRQFSKDLDLGMRMFLKGKLSILPSFSNVINVNRIFSRVSLLERGKTEKKK